MIIQHDTCEYMLSPDNFSKLLDKKCLNSQKNLDVISVINLSQAVLDTYDIHMYNMQ